jgi:predicted peptidase
MNRASPISLPELLRGSVGVLLPLWLASALPSKAESEPDPRLKPDSSFTVQFPEMPPTFYAAFEKKNLPAQMTVYLPANYDRAKKQPLLIFLSGGDGGGGGNPTARTLAENKDFIGVSMPFFKVKVPATAKDSKTGGFGDFIVHDEDGKYTWPFFHTMLQKLETIVPNIDPAHCILGGFSNGAHTTQALIDNSDGEVARHFSAFFFVEGGGHLQHYELLKGKPFLMVSSSSKSRPRAQQICDAATEAGAKAMLIAVDVGGHDFPASSYPQVREWLRGPALQ